MSDIKAVIQLLCQHLNILLKVNLKPENFRLAKFNNNNPETIQELWDTLVKLCKALGSKISLSEKCNSQVWVKLRLASQGYNSAEFYSLPADNTSGSRELLLALMWIIANENALATLTQECVRQSPLCQEYSDAPTQEVLNGRSTVSILNSQSKKALSLEDQINYCLWLANQIKYNINQIHDLEEERIKNTHKVHEATAGSSGLPHLSVFETKLVRDPELLKQWMPKLSKLNDLLTTHSKWLKKKSAFWEWMGTVVELKEKELSSNSLQQGDESALADFVNAARMYAGTRTPDTGSNTMGGCPRFFISSLYAKSTNNLVRKASSSDLLADMGLNENGVIIHASDWLAQIDTELQDIEKMRHEKLQELNLLLQSMTQKLGIVAIADVSSGEVESEDCSK
ncbi:tubulin epsilon and delta complex protein 1-like [Thrips palmi]|uniref:Tubulin epsilon and delta complex protein 1-like n=1 Tax=Thrips palmi TaxID=161013 RepID=A0A6P8YA46_THRPL|nr:tubulin epsilon and delta complex protein 1-like [Thrips palmi]